MTSPFLSLTLFDLALEVNIAAGKANSWTNNPEEQERNNAMVKKAFLAMLVAFGKEASSWDMLYQQELLEKWGEATRTPTNPFARQYTEVNSAFNEKAGTKRTVEEQVEMIFVDHGIRPWATPRGVAPEEPWQKERINQVHKALMGNPPRYDLAERLLDWPESGPMLVAMSSPPGSWMRHYPSRPNSQGSRIGWAGLVQKQSATALKLFVRHGAEFKQRDEQGMPYLAYATTSDVAALFLEEEDLLAIHHPFEQRKKDAEALLAGWKPSIEEHLRRSPGNGRREFSGVGYLEQRLALWPKSERDAVLLPLLSNYVLENTLQIPKSGESMVGWAHQLAGKPSMEELAVHAIHEGENTWTFEQWCCVRFLRGHTNKPDTGNGRPRVNRLATTFSPKNTSERGTLTADLYALVAWCDPDQAKDQDPSEWVPLERLAPLLTTIMNGDQELPQEHRNRLHWLMLTLMESPSIHHQPAMAPLLTAYTRWAWQEPTLSPDLASKGIMEWLTQPENAALFTPGERHFVAINHMTSSIPFKPALARAAWKLVGETMAERGHEQDHQTLALPSPSLASGKVRATPEYTALVKAMELEQQLPSPVTRVNKPRF